MAIIKVVCGIILKGENVFICRRSTHKSLGGYWEFPGGKMEPDETPEESLQRELLEELGMKVSVGPHFKTVAHVYEQVTIELVAYVCQFETATYQLTDHDKYEWIPKSDLHKRRLAPADIPIAKAWAAS